MNSFQLRKELGRVVLGEEEMVDGRRDFDPEPLGKLSILYTEVRNGLFDSDLLEELCEAISLNDLASESTLKVSRKHVKN